MKSITNVKTVGPTGGKIIGSGGGGFLLIYCKKEYQNVLKKECINFQL